MPPRETIQAFFLLFFIWGCIHTVAATLYVSPTGTDGPGCGTPSIPCQSISHAASIAHHHTIHLYSGVYSGIANRDIQLRDRLLRLEGEAGVVVQLDGLGRLFEVANTSLAMHAIVVENGLADTGGVLHVTDNSSVVLEQCIFRNNRAVQRGGVLAFVDTHLLVTQCDFVNNTAVEGGQGGALFGSRSGGMQDTPPIRLCHSHFLGNVAQTTSTAVAEVH